MASVAIMRRFNTCSQTTKMTTDTERPRSGDGGRDGGDEPWLSFWG
jgi:hypothetical protein